MSATFTAIGFNEVPRYSPWPGRLLGAVEFTPRRRTAAEVMREYDRDKWGAVLDWLKKQQRVTEDDLLRGQGADPDQQVAFMQYDDFFVGTIRDVLAHYDQLLIETLRPARPEKLVELGCGLGDKLLKVAAALKPKSVYGGEFTASGVACGRLLAEKMGLQARFDRFDYNDASTLAGVPTGAVVFTSHSIEQIPDLAESFIEGVIRREPTRVVHLEPGYEDQDPHTLIGMMRRRYAEVNDYSRNLIGRLKSFEARGLIEILSHRANVFSDTPFNPTTIIEWRPR